MSWYNKYNQRDSKLNKRKQNQMVVESRSVFEIERQERKRSEDIKRKREEKQRQLEQEGE